MDSTFELYSIEGDEAEFWGMRPDLNEMQYDLLGCFYSATRETKHGEKCSLANIEKALRQCCYETDLAIRILQNLDDHYLKLCADKMKRQANNGR